MSVSPLHAGHASFEMGVFVNDWFPKQAPAARKMTVTNALPVQAASSRITTDSSLRALGKNVC